jgi:hypothetical protein
MTLTAPALASAASSTGDASGIASQLASGAWAPGGAAAFQVPFAQAGGTTVRIVSWALEYVHPLDQWLDALVGDRAQVASVAQTWTGAASDLRDARGQVAGIRGRTAEQQGRTARALRKRLDDIVGALGEAADWAAAAAAALELASTIVTAVHDAVVGALSELAGLVVDLFGFTANPFEKIDQLRELVHRAEELIRVVGQLIDRMTTAFEQLRALLQALQPVVDDILERLRPVLAEIVHHLSGLTGAAAGAELGPLGMLAGGYLGEILGGGAADEVEPDLRVTELDPATLTPEQRVAYDEARGVTSIDSFADAVRGNGYVDRIGGTDRSVVDITRIRSADGQERYVVALPSTQEWDFPGRGDRPAVNDLDTNVALMTMDDPAHRTQYERAVMQAMSDAGIPPGAHVVYTGFSQGGIMAASIAEHDRTYTTDAIITNGSPIGGYDIPPSTRVLSFAHATDPVPVADLQYTDASASDPNRTDVHLPNPPEGWTPSATHNNDHYVSSVQAWEAQNPTAAADVRAMVTGQVVDRQLHTFHE